MDLSLYTDESQIEKKTSGKRKINANNVKKSTPTAKIRKTDVERASGKKLKTNTKLAKVKKQLLFVIYIY